MFDKFIESASDADQNSRRSYFLVSTIVVGILFVTGVIASIYAQDIGLGTDDFELTRVLAPVVPETPEPPRPEQPQQPQQIDRTTLPSRVVNMARVDEIQRIPDTPSVVPNTYLSRPPGDFVIGPDRAGLTSAPTGIVGTDNTASTGSRPVEPETIEPEKAPAPPAIKKTPPIVSKGPVTGLAIDLPKPAYSAAAKAIGAEGDVVVQVLIDERGNVVSAEAVKGHPMLKPEAVRAARKARFRPTTLGDVPVKVTGIITYRFSK